jgi:RNA polymerase sigma-70 factor (ECF subfamily)
MRNPHVDDADLATRAAGGEGDAFGELVERYAPAVRRVARAALQNDADADDAAQQAFLKAWQNLHRYDPARPFGPWLMRIVMNAAADLRRRRRVRQGEELPESLAGAGASPEQETERAMLRARLVRGLERLPARQRIAVTMFDAAGYSHAEIAEALGVPEGTVRSDVFHGRRALRKELGMYREG